MESDSAGRFSELAKTFAIKHLLESEVELVADVPYAAVEPYRTQALAHIAEHLELPGFRPGKVPHDMALKKVGDVAVLEEAVELFVKDFYPELVLAHNLDAVGRPDIRITKLAPGNPVGLTVRTSVYPQVELPKDYKTLHEKVPLEPAPPATDAELIETLESLRKNRAEAAAQTATPILDAEGKPASTRDDSTRGGPLPAPLPELSDAFAQSLGAFTTLDELKEQIKKGIGEEKARKAKDERRGKIIEALLPKVTVAVPRIFIESELDKILAQMREDVQRFGMTFEDYLGRVEKSEEAIRNEFREQAAKRAKLQLTLNKIGEVEKVSPSPEEVEAEMSHALKHFPDAKPGLLRVHVETVLRNDKVLQLLEGVKPEDLQAPQHDHQH